MTLSIILLVVKHIKGQSSDLIRAMMYVSKNYCISPNVGRYFGLVTGPPPAMEAMEAAAAMEAMEAAAAAMEAATERFRRLFVCL